MSFAAPTLIQQNLPSGAHFLGTISSAEMDAFVDIAKCLVVEAKQLDAISVVGGQIVQEGSDVFVKANLPSGFKDFQAGIDFVDGWPRDLTHLRGGGLVSVYTHAGEIYFCNPQVSITVPCLHELQQDNEPTGEVFATATPNMRATKVLCGVGGRGEDIYLHAVGRSILHVIGERSRIDLQGKSFLDLQNLSPSSCFYQVPSALFIKGSAVTLELYTVNGEPWCRAKWRRTAPNDIILSAQAFALQPEDIALP